jgi:hypothetical protein
MSGAQGFSFKLSSNSFLGAAPVSNLKRNIHQGGRATEYSVSCRLNALSLESEFLGTNSPVPEEVARPWDEQEEKQVVVSENGNGPEHTSVSMLPEKPIGLYDPSFERDSCGVGFIAELSGMYKRETVRTLYFVLLFWRNWFSYAFWLNYLLNSEFFCCALCIC